MIYTIPYTQHTHIYHLSLYMCIYIHIHTCIHITLFFFLLLEVVAPELLIFYNVLVFLFLLYLAIINSENVI